MARATKGQLENRKENALALLDQCTDEYRTFYASLAGVNDPTFESLAQIKHKRELLDFKVSAIHEQIKLLDELIATYNTEESA